MSSCVSKLLWLVHDRLPRVRACHEDLDFCRPDDTWIDLLQSCEVIFVRMFVDVEINYKMPSV